MQPRSRFGVLCLAVGLSGTWLGCEPPPDDEESFDTTNQAATTSSSFSDDFGTVQVFSTASAGIDRKNPFFKSLGTNGRTCNSCHKLENALGISVASIRQIFEATGGTDPIFRINDGSNAPTGFYANTSSVAARRTSFSMLLDHGVIRVGLPVPGSTDYTLAAVRDPYFFASAAELSLFRRPMPSVNMAFHSHVMWDGRESEGRAAVRDALINQANDATTGHAQRATPIDSATRAAIADFQLKLFSAQSRGTAAGALDVAGCKTNEVGEPCEEARGNARNLAAVLKGSPGSEEQGSFGPFAIGINDPFGSTFKNISFTVFEPWESENFPESDTSATTAARGEIGDGENIFYTKPINLTGVAGLNDVLGKPVVQGFCTTCHNTPDVGTHSRPRLFDTGVADASGANPLFTSDFPIYTFRRKSDGFQRSVTDPGLALRTGKFKDLGKFKAPSLRGLGSRAPYFHNGSAKTLTDVVNFYNRRFNIGLTGDEIRKVVLFLQQT
jgi:cytochrome c peroxidase